MFTSSRFSRRAGLVRSLFAVAASFVVAFSLIVAMPAREAHAQAANGVTSDLVISQIYTRGGEPGATFQNDYVELFNRGTNAVSINGYSLQLTTTNGNITSGANLGLFSLNTLFIQPGQYFLIQLGSSGANGATLPVTADYSLNFLSILNLGSTNGKIALVRNTQGLPTAICPATDASVADYVGYGTVNCAEGATPATAPTLATALTRSGGGCLDTNNNLLDFTFNLPNPHNANSPRAVCSATTNSIDDTAFFVRQQYADFLNREPDTAGLFFWTSNIESCGADAGCREVKRIDTSAAFFLSIEFQQTGYFVYRIYKAAYTFSPEHPGGLLRFGEFLPDTQEVGRNVVVGQAGWEAQLEQNRQSFVNEFVARPSFLAEFPSDMTATQYVEKLNANTRDINPNGWITQDEQRALVLGLENGTETRATVLRKVADNAAFQSAQFNRAFVVMQYFGYLRRNINDAPDTDFSGYNFWLQKLDSANGDYRRAEMVKAFLSSTEYRRRFAPQ